MSETTLPALKPEGSLAEHDFPDLVQELGERRWTGVLILSYRGVGKNVQVHDGRMVFASSSDPDERLGELLLRRGRISLRQYDQAGRSIGPGKRLGTVLVEQAVLAPKDLIRAVVEHTQEIIYGAFQWTEGRYRLQVGEESAEAITLKMSTPDIIVEGIRRIDSWSRVRRGVGGLEATYRRSTDFDDYVRFMSLSPEQQAILTAMAEPQALVDICEGSSLPDFEVCRTIWAYRVIGLVRRLDEPAPAPVASAGDEDDDGLGDVLAEG